MPTHVSSVPGWAPHEYVPLPWHPVRPVLASVMHCHDPDAPPHSRAPVDTSVVHENDTPDPRHDASPPDATEHVNASFFPRQNRSPSAAGPQTVHVPLYDGGVGVGDEVGRGDVFGGAAVGGGTTVAPARCSTWTGLASVEWRAGDSGGVTAGDVTDGAGAACVGGKGARSLWIAATKTAAASNMRTIASASTRVHRRARAFIAARHVGKGFS